MAHPRIARHYDWTVALAALGFSVWIVLHSASTRAYGWGEPLSLALAPVASLPLVFWRRAPVAVFVITLLAASGMAALGYAGAPPVGATIALYLLANSRREDAPWNRSLTELVVALFALHFAALSIGGGKPSELTIAGGALVWTLAWFAGERGRLRRTELFELKERALRAERDGDRERRLALAEERARIARDLHDSAAHAINVIAVQAGAARLHLDTDPDRSRASLETVEAIATQTVTDIDQIVHGLRDPVKLPAGPVEPPAGLAALGSLLAEHRAAGLAVQLETAGERRRLRSNVDSTAYRILQEALTNCARHGTGPARVRLAFRPDALELAVVNAIAAKPRRLGAARTNGGHGLVGMRERASLVGGSLDAGFEGSDFRVHALLPYAAPS